MKRFLIAIISPLRTPVLLLLIALIYFLHVSEDITGDMGMLGQIVFSKEYHLQEKFQINEENRILWCDSNHFNRNSIALFGDSFTALTSFPCSLINLVHVPITKFYADNIGSSEQSFVALCNMNNVDMPEIVIIESVERELVFRLCDLDFRFQKIPNASVWPWFYDANASHTDFMSFYKNRLIKNHSILRVSMHDSLFSCPGKEKELYFYYDDLSFPEEEQIQTAISNLDSLFQLAKKKNICLFYVVAADKYDVYQEFAVDNRFPEKTLLDNFSSHESNPYFVNTKHVLLKNARQGVKDLYYADDTHWSPIGAKIVAEEIARRMDSLGVLRN